MRLILYILIFIPVLCHSQVKDALLWAGASVDLELTKDLTVQYESQARLDHNFNRFRQYYSELQLEYELFDETDVAMTYRYSRKNDGDYFYNENRLAFDMSYQFKTPFGLDISPRLRYQHAFDRFKVVNEIYPDRKNIVRFKVKADYKHDDFKLLQPFFSTEYFHALSPKNDISFLDSYRFRLGVTIDLPDRHEFKLFYMFELENRSSINHNHVYSIQYSYSLKDLRKWKKD